VSLAFRPRDLFVCEWVKPISHVKENKGFKIPSNITTVLCVKNNRARRSTFFDKNRVCYEIEEEEVLGSDDKSIFGKGSLFRLKFEYVIFVT